MSKMTLDEKVGQMNQYNGFWDATGPLPKKGYEKGRYDDLRNGLVGSMLNVTSCNLKNMTRSNLTIIVARNVFTKEYLLNNICLLIFYLHQSQYQLLLDLYFLYLF